jgi:hypothetical protein
MNHLAVNIFSEFYSLRHLRDENNILFYNLLFKAIPDWIMHLILLSTTSLHNYLMVYYHA